MGKTLHSPCNHDRKGLNLEVLSEKLRQAGLKLTLPRREILHALLHHPKPISADEIFKKGQKNQGLDLVTIYRCLKKFEELKLVSRTDFGDGISRFELVTSSGAHHHHVVCRVCSKVEALHLCDLEPHLRLVEKMGYTELTHRLEFFGVCSQCH